ncbi:NADP oxidoreductase coenzyme F420-dependent [compost metagenome]
MIGIIGVGSVTMDFAHRAAKSGYKVLISDPLGTRTFKEIAQKMGSNVKLVSIDEATIAQIIVLFISRQNLEMSIRKLPDMSGKIILHTNNPIFNEQYFLDNKDSKSSCEIIASLLPRAHIIKLFNILSSRVNLLNEQNQDKNVLFFSGKNQMINDNVKAFLETLNLSGIDITQSQQNQ